MIFRHPTTRRTGDWMFVHHTFVSTQHLIDRSVVFEVYSVVLLCARNNSISYPDLNMTLVSGCRAYIITGASIIA